MNELEQIVQSMIDSGQPEENINAVIAEYQSQQEGKTNATAEETALVVAETPADTDLQLEDGSLESPRKSVRKQTRKGELQTSQVQTEEEKPVDAFVATVPFIPRSVQKGMAKFLTVTVPEAIDLGMPVTGATAKFDQAQKYQELINQVKSGKRVTERKDGKYDVINLSGGISRYDSLDDFYEEYTEKAKQDFKDGAEKYVNSEQYQELAKFFGEDPRVLDGLTAGEFGELLGTQGGQMVAAGITLGMSTYAQEAGGMLRELVENKVKSKYDWDKLSNEEKKEKIVEVVENGEIDFSSIEKSAMGIAAIDAASNALGIGKLAARPAGSLFRNLLAKNYKGAVKAFRGDLVKVGQASLFELPTELTQELVSDMEVSSQLGEDFQVDPEQMAEVAAQTLISTGGLVGSGRVVNRAARNIVKNPFKGNVKEQVAKQREAVDIAYNDKLKNIEKLDPNSQEEAKVKAKQQKDAELTALYEAESIASNSEYRNFEPEAKEKMFNIQIKQQELRNKNKKLKSSYTGDNVLSAGQTAVNNEKIAELEAEKLKAIGLQIKLNEGNGLRSYINSNPKEFNGYSFLSFKTKKEAKEYIEKQGIEKDENVQALIDGDAYAVKIPGKKLAIDVKETSEKGAIGIGANAVHHEALHMINESISNDGLQNTVSGIKEFVGKSQDETLKAIVNYAENRVKTDYAGSSQRVQNEEFMSSVSDMMRQYQIETGNVQGATALSKLGGRIAEFIGKKGPKDFDYSRLENPAEVINFLRKYNSFNGRPKLGLKLNILEDGKVNIEDTEKETLASKSNLQGLLDEADSNTATFINNAMTDSSGDFALNMLDSKFGKEVAPILEDLAKKRFDPIPEDATAVVSENRAEARKMWKEDLLTELITEVSNKYKPGEQDLDKFVTIRAFQRSNRTAKNIGIQSTIEQGGQGIAVDVTEAKGIIADEPTQQTTESTLERLNIADKVSEDIDKLSEMATIQAEKTIGAKEVSDLKKLNARNKTFGDIFAKRLFNDIKNVLGKNTKTKSDFSEFLNNNYEALSDIALNYIDFQKGAGPSALWNLDNPPTQFEFIEYYEGKDVKTSTRADRKKSLNNAIARAIANDARVKLAKENPGLNEGFKKATNISLGSLVYKTPLTLKGLPFISLTSQLPGYTTKGNAPFKNVTAELTKKFGGKIDYAKKGAWKKHFDLAKLLVEDEFPVELIEKATLHRSSGRLYNESEYRVKVNGKSLGLYDAGKEFQGTGKNKKPNENLDPESAKLYKAMEAEYAKEFANFQDFIKSSNKAKTLYGDAEGWTGKDYVKHFGVTSKDILNTVDKVEAFNKSNLAMHEQAWRSIFKAIENNPETIVLLAALTSTDKGTNNFHRFGAEYVGYSIDLASGVEWEHALPANTSRLILLHAAQEGVKFDEIYPIVQNNYKLIALAKSDDGKLKKAGRQNSMGEDFNIYTDSFVKRYFADAVAIYDGGINPSGIVDFNNQTFADKYSIDANGNSTKAMASKVLSEDFNKMLERVKGVKAEARYSEDRANKLAGNKGKFKFFVPYSAEDYVGLIYPTLGKGKEGDRNLQWYKDNIINPFAVGIANFEKAKVESLEQWRNLKKQISKTPAKLNKEAVRGFTNEEALRVYLWNEQDVVPDTLAKKDVEALVKHVEDSKELTAFAENVKGIVGPGGYPAPGNNWLSGSLTIDLIDNINTGKRTEFLQQWQDNVDVVYSKDNMNKLKALYGERYTEALENILYRMKTGRNRPSGATRLENQFMNWVNDSVGTVMFFNTRSALLQTISAVNFLNWSDNNPLMAAKAFANQPRFWKDFADLFNSDFLKSRRSGLKNDINADELAKSAATSDNKVRAGLSALLKAGFLPTQIADSFAISIGGASFYRNRLNTYKKQGLSEEQAKEKAMLDFQETAEESQQSSRPDRVSMQQASSLGRVILAFANTPMQYTRLTKKAALDLVNGRGDWKTNMSKILYYGAVQNIIFTALQQAMFAMLFDDDEIDDEEQTEASTKIVSGIADTFLRGSGVGGAAVATMKNIIMEIIKQKESKRPDYTKAALKLTTLSPPIDTKIRKLMSAGRAFTYRQSLKDMNRLGVDIDNPAALATGQVLSAVANLPADRAILKMRNVKGALDTEHEAWQRIAMGLGFSDWQLGIEKDKSKTDKTKAQIMRELKKSNPFEYKRRKAKERREKKIAKMQKKSPTKKLERGVAGRANNDGTIEIDPNLSPVEREKTIAHEEQHMKDMKAGKLDYDDNYVYWNGGKHERKNGKIKYKGKSYIEGHKDLPWEKKAYAAEPSTAEAKKRTKLYA